MNLALRKPMTLAEFLEWEERQPLRYEFDGVGPVAMTGGTRRSRRHPSEISPSPSAGASAASRVTSYGSDLKIQIAEGHVRYPDGMVVCSPLDRTATVVYDPVVIFEVLSPSTARNDRIVKAREYQATPIRAALRHARTGRRQRHRLRPLRRDMDARNPGRRLHSRPA